MTINLNDKYRINSQDSNNIAIEKRMVSQKTGEEYFTAVSFHSSLSNAMISAVDSSEIMINMENRKDFKKWIKEIESLVETIKNNL